MLGHSESLYGRKLTTQLASKASGYKKFLKGVVGC